MNVPHPDGKRLIFMQSGTPMMAEADIGAPGWTSIGFIGDNHGGLLVGSEEWAAFVALINEVNAVKLALPQIEAPKPEESKP